MPSDTIAVRAEAAGRLTAKSVISGAEFRAFYLDNWPGRDWCLEDCGYEIEDELGHFTLADDARLALGNCGYLVWQNFGKPPSGPDTIPFLDAYSKFAERVTTDIVIVDLPAGKREQLEHFVRELGGTMRPAIG